MASPWYPVCTVPLVYLSVRPRIIMKGEMSPLGHLLTCLQSKKQLL
jgi:hypothetical protein